MNNIYIYGFWASLFFERTIWLNYLKHNNYSIVQIGFLQTILTLVMFISELPSGVLTDKFGAKKVMYVGHLFISLYLLMMLFNINIGFLMFGFMSYGIGLALISGSDQTLLHQHNPKQTYQSKIGKYTAYSIIGMTLSSIFGGYLTTISWSSIFILGIFTQIISIFILVGIKISKENKNKINKTITISCLFDNLKEVLKKKNIRYLLITIAIFQGIMSVLLNFTQLLLANKSFSPFGSSIVISLGLLSAIISSFSIERISKKMGRNTAIRWFLLLLSSGFLLLSFSNFTLIVLSLLIIRFSFEFVDTSLNIVIQELSNDKIRTTLISGVNTLTALIMFVGTSIITILFSIFNVSFVFVILGVVLVLFTSLFYLLFLKNHTT